MTDPLFDGDDEANTSLTVEEREQMIPTAIGNRAELNEAEQINITKAMRRLARTRTPDVLNDAFWRDLHRRMFGDVWKWAGRYRTSPRNIGIEAYLIVPRMRELLDDLGYWIDNGTYDPDEIAARFSHRIVSIHPFANGNGRHSRIAADIVVNLLGKPRFTWGRVSLVDDGIARKTYIAALQAADRTDIQPLLAFARS